jgi:hypothetical protein
MSSSKFNAASKAALIASRSVDIEYTEVKVPVPEEDFSTKFKTATGLSTGLSNQRIINVLPNFVPLFLFCAYHANQYIGLLEPRNHAKVSAATLTYYFLNIVYAHFLISDIYIRPVSSPYADEIMDKQYSREYVYYLLNLPVPEFLLPILKYFTTSSTPRRSNIIFSPSFTGYSHRHHFGKILPLNLLTNIHDLASSVSGRSDPDTINVELLTTPLYSINNIDYSTGMLIAALIPASATTQAPFTYLDNKVNQAFKAMFNPVLLRALQQKQTFAPINLAPFSSPNLLYNPYHCMLSISPKNVSEHKTLLTSLASTFKGIIKCPGDLASTYANASGISIINHGYSHYALPTAHASPLTFSDTHTGRTKPMSSSDFAIAIQFKQRQLQATLPAQTNLLPTCSTDATHTVTYDTNAYLIEDRSFPPNETVSNTVPAFNSFLIYSDERDFYPKVLVLNPFELDPESAWLSTLCGMTIESEELEATTVLHPNPDLHIGVENSHFAQSLIPLRSITPTTDFKRSPDYKTSVQPRDTHLQTFPPAATLFRSSTKIFLPTVIKDHRYKKLNSINYGLTRLPHVTWAEKFQTFLGFTINDSNTKAFSLTEHAPPHSPDFDLLVWSPYTYGSAKYDFEIDNDHFNDNLRHLFMFTNFRSFFGTDVTLVEVSHSLEAMPIS